ncbi:glyoxylate/hydroxypyruvate reductase GhrA [uncultured Cedecea sp.]|uniref:glyoxylate/hydroxypyruvate reductase GhrA n=1 Tax=uncultured Cedecea sp. TaxID=988762 RepID=UPI002609A7AC|nr:glyoxylate/hydroxypyruvate reductase GhrA [uncultured Cedecea sp.]
MDIIFYHPALTVDNWLQAFKRAIPQARIRQWTKGDDAPADYALVWNPPVEVLRQRKGLKAVFVLGAGVDAILSKFQQYPDMLAQGVPLYRLEDTGMAQQMQEYAVSQVLHWFRRFDDYQLQKIAGQWQPLDEYRHEEFTVGLLGAGVLGGKVAESLTAWGFPVRCWSRSNKEYPGVSSYVGNEQLPAFLSGTRVLINLLPNTPQTAGIINQNLLNQLAEGAYVLNLARGAHLVESDLLAALDSGKIKGAMLDVFAKEPLPVDSPLWRHPRVAITPHIAAVSRPDEAATFIASTVARIEEGTVPAGEVSISRGY